MRVAFDLYFVLRVAQESQLFLVDLHEIILVGLDLERVFLAQLSYLLVQTVLEVHVRCVLLVQQLEEVFLSLVLRFD